MPQWQLRIVYLATSALVLSGTIWLLLHYFARAQSEFGPVPSAFEHPLLAIHGAAAMAFLIVLGSLLPVHLIRGWNQRRNLWSGITLLTIHAFLIVTGYGLYYFGGDLLRAWLSATHWIVGLSVAGLLAWHIVIGRSGRRR